VQAKLEVGQQDDPYEREADRVAEQVMAMKEPPQQSAGSTQRSAFNAPRLSLNAHSALPRGIEVSPELEAQIQSLRSSGGRPLSSSERAFFEPRFGHDLGRVRIHDSSLAVESARAVSARAFTIGSDIVVGSGECSPNEPRGHALLAHELAHVNQQRSGNALGRYPLGGFPQENPQPKTPSPGRHRVECAEWVPVDDTWTKRVIDTAMRSAGGKAGKALSLVIAQRSGQGCCDLSLAAADHYLFARDMVGSSWYMPSWAMAAGATVWSIVPSVRFGECPKSPPDSRVIWWGMKGAFDGSVDWELSHPYRGPVNPDLDASTYKGFGAFK